MAKYTFSENNSGGYWWLSRQNYQALFDSGWEYTPSEYDIQHGHDRESFLGSKKDNVPYGWRHGLTKEASSLREAVESWEDATGKDFFAEGCNCCGAPFSIYSDDYTESMSGDSVRREVVRPW